MIENKFGSTAFLIIILFQIRFSFLLFSATRPIFAPNSRKISCNALKLHSIAYFSPIKNMYINTIPLYTAC